MWFLGQKFFSRFSTTTPPLAVSTGEQELWDRSRKHFPAMTAPTCQRNFKYAGQNTAHFCKIAFGDVKEGESLQELAQVSPNLQGRAQGEGREGWGDETTRYHLLNTTSNKDTAPFLNSCTESLSLFNENIVLSLSGWDLIVRRVFLPWEVF